MDKPDCPSIGQQREFQEQTRAIELLLPSARHERQCAEIRAAKYDRVPDFRE